MYLFLKSARFTFTWRNECFSYIYVRWRTAKLCILEAGNSSHTQSYLSNQNQRCASCRTAQIQDETVHQRTHDVRALKREDTGREELIWWSRNEVMLCEWAAKKMFEDRISHESRESRIRQWYLEILGCANWAGTVIAYRRSFGVNSERSPAFLTHYRIWNTRICTRVPKCVDQKWLRVVDLRWRVILSLEDISVFEWKSSKEILVKFSRNMSDLYQKKGALLYIFMILKIWGVQIQSDEQIDS